MKKIFKLNFTGLLKGWPHILKIKKILLLAMLFNICAVVANAQQQTITGVVTDSQTNEAMPGVNVVVKGTTIGTMSGIDGRFSLPVSDPNTILVFSFIGYTSQEVPVAGRSNITISLAADLQQLEEVVVVGYGSQTRKSLTGAISAVNSQALAKETSANAITRLQGKASGVEVLNARAPGAEATITIRGLGTINNNAPLFVIDGVPTKSATSQLNPDEIESVTVLKDASSAAIYGARGANGVIIVTTKRGTSGKARVSFNSRTGFSNFNNWYDLLNTREFGEMVWLQAKNMGLAPSHILYGSGAEPVIPDYVYPTAAMEGDPGTLPDAYVYAPGTSAYNNITKANKEGTNWFEEVSQTGVLQEYNLALSGGNEGTTYAFNIGYLNEKGIVKYTEFDRYSLRSNSDAHPTKWLTIGESLGLTYTVGKGDRSEANEWSPIGYSTRMAPIIPVYDIMGRFAGTRGTGTEGTNPLSVAYRGRDNYQRGLRGLGNVYGEIRFMEGLRLKSLFGFDYRPYENKSISRQSPEAQEASLTDVLSISSGTTIQWNWANTLNFTRVLADVHRVNLLLGTEAVAVSSNSFSASRSTFFSDDVNYMYLDAGEQNQVNSGSGSDVKWMSYFGRFNYDYREKYLLEATLRYDGSSRFGANSRWGTFPAFSAAWRVSDESFMESTENILSNLKFRLGWGKSGNDEVGNYNGFSTFSSNQSSASYPITGSISSANAGFYSSAFGNPDAQWETTTTTNVGFDLGFLQNTLTATVDIWRRKTEDMLYRISIPMVNGAASAPSVNIGDMDNKGYDLNIDYRNKAIGGSLTYSFGLTFSQYRNKILKISGKESEFINGGEFRYMRYTRAQMGTAYPEFYGLIVDGIFQTQDEATEHPPIYGGAYNIAGHFKYRDVNGDGMVNDNDRGYIGTPHPKFTAGFNTDIAYKGIGLSAFFYARYGNKVANYIRRFYDFTQFNGNRSKDRLYRSWGSPYLADNADAVLPLADTRVESQYPSTAFLEDGSFLRLKTLQLSYSLPKSLMQKLTVSKIDIYVQGTNLFTMTKYKGLDPEIPVSGINAGVDASQWPTSRQIVFGLRLDI